MLFSSGMLLAGGATIALAVLDKSLEGWGYQWLGTFLKLAIPILAFATGIYFIETNPILRWLR
jgi:hypothetical protein